MTFRLTSSAFENGADIPPVHTCDGSEISPPLSWSGVPDGTKSLALIIEDPDAPDPAAPQRVFTHWVLYNIPAHVIEIGAGASPQHLPAGTLEGLNDWKRPGFGGPCPPIGKHRYFHRLYALDAILPDLGNPAKSELQQAMQAHVVATAELIGTYQRKQ
ncbi:YbhB/YbcL family Raf kinase inhibitor-like protein [Noviherbaspirillum saxi]|uniref:YbhB/YbcL family Raf kinase inhibitor-like protein n=1 Tax=Noviherbaspirillum saxi TaxID=2320863 RepID=A0A3A3FMF2_9BURK|nr:YbhB/YbcL family Raf kinase inhibitor-like protein [Noviherbaspirillum saxi]RJF95665.1 YbhB/YbcL family Raf kinase inhibitor-like protein [Noviherbaspirillum saxi]